MIRTACAGTVFTAGGVLMCCGDDEGVLVVLLPCNSPARLLTLFAGGAPVEPEDLLGIWEGAFL